MSDMKFSKQQLPTLLITDISGLSASLDSKLTIDNLSNSDGSITVTKAGSGANQTVTLAVDVTTPTSPVKIAIDAAKKAGDDADDALEAYKLQVAAALDEKLEISNILSGDQVTVSNDGTDVTIAIDLDKNGALKTKIAEIDADITTLEGRCDDLAKIARLRGGCATKAALDAIVIATAGINDDDLYVVFADETHDGNSSLYKYDEDTEPAGWIYLGKFEVTRAASSIDITTITGVSGGNVQAALESLKTQVDGKQPAAPSDANSTDKSYCVKNGQWVEIADASNIITSVNGQSPVSGAITVTATDIGCTATGNIAATNVQSALAELDTEKLTKSGNDNKYYLAYNGGLAEFQPTTLHTENLSSQLDGVKTTFTYEAELGASYNLIYNGTIEEKNYTYTIDTENKTVTTTRSVAPAAGERLLIQYWA